jgi:hypothetical protein
MRLNFIAKIFPSMVTVSDVSMRVSGAEGPEAAAGFVAAVSAAGGTVS